MMGRRLPRGMTRKDLQPIFERTVVAMCREARFQTRFTPADIDAIVRDLVSEFPATLEELSIYVEDEDWDGLYALALQEHTMRLLRRRV